MDESRIKQIIAKLTIEEKARLTVGADVFHTYGVEEKGIPSILLSDGPHGLRKQNLEADNLGIKKSIPAVGFPAGCGVAASFNRELIAHMGEVLGEECQAEGIAVLLGPAMNIKRSPLCGRNFEYYSEDPYVASEMAAAFVHGIQKKNVGACPKHFLANNQEHYRMSASSNVEERALREIYLAAFETMVKKEKPWSIMCAYNKINGTYVAESSTYLTDVLRKEWGFDGFVVSDWGAVNDRVNNMIAGLDLEMPSSGEETIREIVAAVQNKKLSEEKLNETCEHLLQIILRFQDHRDETAVFDREKDYEEARKIAEETVVLLKNDNLLPIAEKQKVAIIGKYAEKPRFQGGGSSHINCSKVSSAFEKLQNQEGYLYAKGFDDHKDTCDEKLQMEAVQLAKESDLAVIFAGLPDHFESEGYDRIHMQLPENQNRLIEEVCKVQDHVVVVLHNGAPVEMPWIKKVKAVVEAYLGGEAIGEVIADILTGKVNPSGKLAETFPVHMEDNPTYLYWGEEKQFSHYREGVFVGYRYYDKKNMEVLFPFGHGLSYTEFQYSNLSVSKKEWKDNEKLKLSVWVENTGSCSGKEVVQIYVRPMDARMTARPIKELRAFDKISLAPGEKKQVDFVLDKRAFAVWDAALHQFRVPTGEYEILVAASSRDIRCIQRIFVEGTQQKKRCDYDLNTVFGEMYDDPVAMEILKPLVEAVQKRYQPSENTAGVVSEEMAKAMVKYMPIRNLTGFCGKKRESLKELVDMVNQKNAES